MRLMLILLAIQIALTHLVSAQVSFDEASQREVDSAMVVARTINKEVGGCATLKAVSPGTMLLTNAYVSYRNQTELKVTLFCMTSEVTWHTHSTSQYSNEYLCSQMSMHDDELYAYARKVKGGVMVCGIGPDSLRIYGPAWDKLLGPNAIKQRGT